MLVFKSASRFQSPDLAQSSVSPCTIAEFTHKLQPLRGMHHETPVELGRDLFLFACQDAPGRSTGAVRTAATAGFVCPNFLPPAWIALGDMRMRQTGTVKFYNSQKGYGFIKPDDGGNDVFVHVTAVERSGIGDLNEGMRISFDTEPDKRGKGPKAVDLQKA